MYCSSSDEIRGCGAQGGGTQGPGKSPRGASGKGQGRQPVTGAFREWRNIGWGSEFNSPIHPTRRRTRLPNPRPRPRRPSPPGSGRKLLIAHLPLAERIQQILEFDESFARPGKHGGEVGRNELHQASVGLVAYSDVVVTEQVFSLGKRSYVAVVYVKALVVGLVDDHPAHRQYPERNERERRAIKTGTQSRATALRTRSFISSRSG